MNKDTGAMALIVYEERHNKIFPDNTVKMIRREGLYVYCETEFGVCKRNVGDVGKYSFGISSAVNKTQFFKNKASKIHNNKYDYSLVNYIDANSKVRIICREHGVFEQAANSHIQGCGCNKCGQVSSNDSKRLTKKEFVNRSNLLHNYKYDYSKLLYTASNKKVIITCPLHGDFGQAPKSHLLGYGCPKCGFKRVGEINSINPTGWSCSRWIETSYTSSKFDCFKVYIIKCWSSEEEFYKIGRTFLKVKQRFNSKSAMPYNYEIIKIFNGEPTYIFDLEHNLKNHNKNNKYLPKLKFSGMKECFNKIEKYDK